MARVFEAELLGEQGFRKRVALKVMHRAMSLDDSTLRASLLNEARLGALLNHINVVDTYDLGEVGGRLFVAMQLVRGITLDQLIKDWQPFPAWAVLEVGAQMCAGLQYVHTLEDTDQADHLVHRDLKPSNVFIARDGTVKIGDFGIARSNTGHGLQTSEGMIRGTPAYMSPEQSRGAELDPRSDLFALGAVLFEMAAGRQLFPPSLGIRGLVAALGDVESYLGKNNILRPVEDAVPGLSSIIGALLHTDPERRPAYAEDVGEDLRDILQRNPPTTGLSRAIRGLLGSDATSTGSEDGAAAPPAGEPPATRAMAPATPAGEPVATRMIPAHKPAATAGPGATRNMPVVVPGAPGETIEDVPHVDDPWDDEDTGTGAKPIEEVPEDDGGFWDDDFASDDSEPAPKAAAKPKAKRRAKAKAKPKARPKAKQAPAAAPRARKAPAEARRAPERPRVEAAPESAAEVTFGAWGGDGHSRSKALPIALAVAALLLIAVLGFLVLGPDGDDAPAQVAETAPEPPADEAVPDLPVTVPPTQAATPEAARPAPTAQASARPPARPAEQQPVVVEVAREPVAEAEEPAPTPLRQPSPNEPMLVQIEREPEPVAEPATEPEPAAEPEPATEAVAEPEPAAEPTAAPRVVLDDAAVVVKTPAAERGRVRLSATPNSRVTLDGAELGTASDSPLTRLVEAGERRFRFECVDPACDGYPVTRASRTLTVVSGKTVTYGVNWHAIPKNKATKQQPSSEAAAP